MNKLEGETNRKGLEKQTIGGTENHTRGGGSYVYIDVLSTKNLKNYETYYRSARVQLSNKFLTNLKNFKLI